MSLSSFKIVAISVGVGLVSATSLLLFLLLRKTEDEEYMLEIQKETTRTVKQNIKRISIPKEAVGRVIGRNGETIKKIQNETKTRINFSDEASQEEARFVVIRGLFEDVQEAEQLICKIINEKSNLETSEMFVQNKDCGKIIGHEGENIRKIIRVSGAKVHVQRSSEQDFEGLRKVIISGLPNQIKDAKKLIEELVDCFDHPMTSPSLTQKATQLKNISYYNDELAQYNQNMYTREKLPPAGSDGFLEVFVSAVNTVDQFWVQLVSGKSIELDRLVEEMTDYYSQPENKDIHKMKELSIGDIVTAPFPYDSSWYRAEITAIEEDSYSEDECKVTVYYVDFGESEVLARKEIFELKKNFLRIPFQAIECCLANIKPKDGVWSTEANTTFEKLTYTAEWKAIRLKVIEQKKIENRVGQFYFVEMVDTTGPHDVKIAEEMIKQGFAIWSKDE